MNMINPSHRRLRKSVSVLVFLLLVFLGFGLTSSVFAHPKAKHDSTLSLKPHLNDRKLFLRSEMALVLDTRRGEVLYEKKSHKQKPIASLTKLMTAMVVLDAKLPSKKIIQIKRADRDRLRGSRSRLSFGTKLTRSDLIKITLAGSDNRAAAALGRTYPGGHKAIVKAMNRKAKALGLKNTVFKGVSGLRSGNVSTAKDLAQMVAAAYRYPTIRKVSTLKRSYVTDRRKGWKVEFMNTNRLMHNRKWDISLSKTGYIADSGHCLVMRVEIDGRPLTIILMNSWGKLSKYGDANRIRKWLNRADKKAQKAARRTPPRARKTHSRLNSQSKIPHS